MSDTKNAERRVADLLARAGNPTTPTEEARTSAAIAARLVREHGLTCSTPFDRDAFARRVRAECLAEQPKIPPPPAPLVVESSPWEKWIFLASGVFAGGARDHVDEGPFAP